MRDALTIRTPYSPTHSEDWLNAFLTQNYYKKTYDRFNWWRSYVYKKDTLHPRKSLRDKILNGDFDPGPYKYEAQVVEHKINKIYIQLFNDQGTYIEKTSIDRARRKRLLEDYEADEKKKINLLIREFTDLLPIPEETVIQELEGSNKDLVDLYYDLTEKYPRKNNIPYYQS